MGLLRTVLQIRTVAVMMERAFHNRVSPAQYAVCSLAASLVMMANAAAAPVYPLKQSMTGRYLVDQNNVPFLMIGDSPQALMVNLSTNEAAMFLADRSTNGFNTVWINLLCTTYTGGRVDGTAIDGLLPFTSKIPLTDFYNLTAPNEAYFAHVDSIINLAAQYGIQVLLDPIETGGFLPTLLANGETRCRAYGQYLGNRYKNFDNLIWMSGNDFQDWRDANNDAVVLAVARGIQDTDTRHLQTVQLDYLTLASSSLDDTNWAGIIQLNATYTYLPTYAQLLKDYNRTNFLPNFMVEANYEFEDNVGNLGPRTPQVLRRQEYWTMLSGAAGQFYGNHYLWRFDSGWQSFLDTAGATQIGYMKSLFESRAWYNLVPDQDHSVLTAGHGTFTTTGSVNDSDYATAARTPDGTLVMVYIPTPRTLTVDMSKLRGTAAARWYDPVNGTYLQIDGSPFLNGGARIFTPPGTNSGGSGDWVLVLEDPPVPALGIRRAGGGTDGIVISFNTDWGRLYDLQATTNLAGPAWLPWVTNIFGTGGIVQIIATNRATRSTQFFRTKTIGDAPALVMRLEASQPGTNGVVIRFNTFYGLTYELQTTTNLAGGVWWPMATNILGTGGTVGITDTNVGSAPARFYRTKWAN